MPQLVWVDLGRIHTDTHDGVHHGPDAPRLHRLPVTLDGERQPNAGGH
ncbi:hypothetical protein [Deinococcus ruber]|nr:hypothetical protein [Deinococcus ruber]